MKEHLTLLSNIDALPLAVVVMRPQHPRGIVQFSHGMCEHKERYFDFMNYLYEQGFVCLIHDHRGHGESLRHADDLGYFYEDGHNACIEDLYQLSCWIQQQYSHLPLYLFGHSMGSLIARCYCQKYDAMLSGLFVCGSPSKNQTASLGIALTQVMAIFKGDHYRSHFIQNMCFRAFEKRFGSTVPNVWICSDKKVIDTYNQDPLCHFTFTLNGFENLFRLMKKTYSSWESQHAHLPIHFIAGEEDPCLLSQKAFQRSVFAIKKQGYSDVTFKTFPKMRHEILNETNHKLVYEHILTTLFAWEKQQDYQYNKE